MSGVELTRVPAGTDLGPREAARRLHGRRVVVPRHGAPVDRAAAGGARRTKVASPGSTACSTPIRRSRSASRCSGSSEPPGAQRPSCLDTMKQRIIAGGTAALPAHRRRGPRLRPAAAATTRRRRRPPPRRPPSPRPRPPRRPPPVAPLTGLPGNYGDPARPHRTGREDRQRRAEGTAAVRHQPGRRRLRGAGRGQRHPARWPSSTPPTRPRSAPSAPPARPTSPSSRRSTTRTSRGAAPTPPSPGASAPRRSGRRLRRPRERVLPGAEPVGAQQPDAQVDGHDHRPSPTRGRRRRRRCSSTGRRVSRSPTSSRPPAPRCSLRSERRERAHRVAVERQRLGPQPEGHAARRRRPASRSRPPTWSSSSCTTSPATSPTSSASRSPRPSSSARATSGCSPAGHRPSGLVQGHWKKTSLEAVTTYTDADGNPILLSPAAPGWCCPRRAAPRGSRSPIPSSGSERADGTIGPWPTPPPDRSPTTPAPRA